MWWGLSIPLELVTYLGVRAKIDHEQEHEHDYEERTSDR
jgi:hypothetical protein